ncbi:malate/lactate/ureidoglycolate dehydrogenase [Roseateles noduli]|uniref:malate/lactate/ureidoglycolate dehydrogenase n=1 Tax=Roseateles noduli TaxID=2052484 RepID=UPI003D65B2D8
MSEALTIDATRLLGAVRLVVAGFGSGDDEIDAVATHLVDANLTGHDSHGIGILPRYAGAYLEGGLKPNAHVRTLLDAGAMLRLDGGAGFGQVIGREAMALGIARARQGGCCIVALGHSHHLGRIGAWAEQAAEAGLVSMHFVNVISRCIVAPFGGSDARFGTNPFAAGVPMPGRPPMILDFATSMLAQGKTRVAHNKGELLEPGILIDDIGRPTRDPRYAVIEPFGAILPFGTHKGYGLAMLCELLGGALAAGLAQHDDDTGQRRVLNGMLSVLIDPAALGDRAAFEREVLAFTDWTLASPPREGVDRVRLAGEPERESRARRLRDGVPIDATTWGQILVTARQLGVDPRAVARAAGTG